MVTIITNNDIEHDTNNNNTNNVYNNSDISRYKRICDGIGYDVVRSKYFSDMDILLWNT